MRPAGAGSFRMEWMDSVMESDDDQIDTYAIAVAFALYKHMDRNGECTPSTRRLANLARCSQRIAMRSIGRLEAAGYLTVLRRHRAVSNYRAATPGGIRALSDDRGEAEVPPKGTERKRRSAAQREAESADDPSDLRTDLHHDGQQTAGGPDESAAFRTESASPRSHRTKEPQPPSSSSATTHDGSADSEQVALCERILSDLTVRRLEQARETRPGTAPPRGDKRRVDGWLKSTYGGVLGQHWDAVWRIVAERPGKAIDYYIWRLEPDLAQHNWSRVSAEESAAKLAAERAERAERAAAETPEQVAARHTRIDDFRRQLQRNLLLRQVPEVAHLAPREAS